VRVIVGRIGRPHGIRGEVVVGVRTDEPDLRFAVGASLDAGPTADGETPPAQILRVDGKRWHSGQLLIAFAGITDRTAAGELTGSWLSVDSSQLPPPPDPDEFRDHELIGLAVRTCAGEAVGEVTDEQLKDRRILGEEGFVSVIIVLDSTTGKAVAPAELHARGSGIDDAAFAGVRPKIEEALARAARTRPNMYLLEDLHWADESTLALLYHLANRIAQIFKMKFAVGIGIHDDDVPAAAQDHLIESKILEMAAVGKVNVRAVVGGQAEGFLDQRVDRK